MTIKDYISALNKRYEKGISGEQSYRGDLQNFLEDLTTRITVTNEPSRIECGAPDYILTTNKDIPIGFIEAKDIGKPLNSKEYKEFLKIDFPRVPYPKDKDTFWQLVELGKELRQIHLLESPKVEQFITSYPKEGDNIITRKMTKNSPGWKPTNEKETIGRVWINDQQYFDGVPKLAWEFYIGGYQPTQKWLKDRKGRQLSYENIVHYQKVIVALTETDHLMKEIDKVEFE